MTELNPDIAKLTERARRVGELVSYLPDGSTYPIRIAGLGGFGLGAARQLRDELTAAVELEEARLRALHEV